MLSLGQFVDKNPCKDRVIILRSKFNFSEQFLNESLLISSLCNMKNISFVPCEYIENLKSENKNAVSKR